MIHYIYKITNKVNGKGYVGKHSTTDINDGYFGSGIALKRAISKYGYDNFHKDILCYCKSEKDLNEMEVYKIEKHGTYRDGYNLTRGGEGKLGYTPSLESILKASKSRKEYYKNNPKAREKLSRLAKKRTGKNNPFYGKKLSSNHIEKMTKARIDAIAGGNNPSARPVVCVEEYIRFSTAKEGSIAVGLKYSTTILKCCKGTRKSAGGYTWKYA